jgi:hypothetical protein
MDSNPLPAAYKAAAHPHVLQGLYHFNPVHRKESFMPTRKRSKESIAKMIATRAANKAALENGAVPASPFKTSTQHTKVGGREEVMLARELVALVDKIVSHR